MPCIKKATIVLGILLNKKRENYPSSQITIPIIKKRVRINNKKRKRYKKKGPQTKKTRAEIRKKIKKIMLKDSFSDVDLVKAKEQSQEPSNNKEERKDKENWKLMRDKKSSRNKSKPTENFEVFKDLSPIEIKKFLARSSQKSSIGIHEVMPEQEFQRKIYVPDNNESIEDLSSDGEIQNIYEEAMYKGDQNSEENKYSKNNRYEEEKDLTKMLTNMVIKKSIKPDRNSIVEEVFKIKKRKRNKKFKKKSKYMTV